MSHDSFSRAEERETSKHLLHIARFLDKPPRGAGVEEAATPFVAAVDLSKPAVDSSSTDELQPILPIARQAAERFHAELAAMGSPLFTLFPLQECTMPTLSPEWCHRPTSLFLDLLKQMLQMLAAPASDPRQAPWVLALMHAIQCARPAAVTHHKLLMLVTEQCGDEAVQQLELTLLTRMVEPPLMERTVAMVFERLMVNMRPAVLYGWLRQLPSSALHVVAVTSKINPGFSSSEPTATELVMELKTRLQAWEAKQDTAKAAANEEAEWASLIQWIDERLPLMADRLRSVRIVSWILSNRPYRFEVVAHLLRQALDADASPDGVLSLGWNEGSRPLLAAKLINCSEMLQTDEPAALAPVSASLLERLFVRVKQLSPAQLHGAGLLSQFDTLLFESPGLRCDHSDFVSRFIGHLLSQYRAWLSGAGAAPRSLAYVRNWSWLRWITHTPAIIADSLADPSTIIYECLFSGVLLLHAHGFRFDASGVTFLRTLFVSDVLILRAWLDRADSGLEYTDWIVSNDIASLFSHERCKDVHKILLEQTLTEWYLRGGYTTIKAELSEHMIGDLASMVLDFLTPPLPELLRLGREPSKVACAEEMQPDQPAAKVKFVGFGGFNPTPLPSSPSPAPPRAVLGQAPAADQWLTARAVPLSGAAAAAASATPALLSFGPEVVPEPTNLADWKKPGFVFNPFAAFIPTADEVAAAEGAAAAPASSAPVFSFAASTTTLPLSPSSAAGLASPAASSSASPTTGASLCLSFSSLTDGPSAAAPSASPPLFTINPFARMAAAAHSNPAAAAKVAPTHASNSAAAPSAASSSPPAAAAAAFASLPNPFASFSFDPAN